MDKGRVTRFLFLQFHGVSHFFTPCVEFFMYSTIDLPFLGYCGVNLSDGGTNGGSERDSVLAIRQETLSPRLGPRNLGCPTVPT